MTVLNVIKVNENEDDEDEALKRHFLSDFTVSLNNSYFCSEMKWKWNVIQRVRDIKVSFIFKWSQTFVFLDSCQRSRRRSSDSNVKSNEPLRRNLGNSNGRNVNRVDSAAAWTRSCPSMICPPSHPVVRPCLRKESSCPLGTSTPLRPCHPSNATSIRFRFL